MHVGHTHLLRKQQTKVFSLMSLLTKFQVFTAAPVDTFLSVFIVVRRNFQSHMQCKVCGVLALGSWNKQNNAASIRSPVVFAGRNVF